MSDFGGYADIFSDRPNQWMADGYYAISDSIGDGYASLPGDSVPSGIIQSLHRVNGGAHAGQYILTLSQAPFALVWFKADPVVPAGQGPASVPLIALTTGFTVGLASAGANPTISFQVYNLSGSPADIPIGGGLFFHLCLTQS